MSPPSTQPVVVTGIGAVCALGLGRGALWEGLGAGVSGIRRVSGSDGGPDGCSPLAGEVADLDPRALLGGKGFRHLSRSAQLVLVATHFAFRDRGAAPPVAPDPSLGLVVGTAVGAVEVISRFDREGLTEGPQYVNPMDFPGTVWNSPAGEAAIRFGLQGLNATVANGLTAGHDALAYAAEALRAGRVRGVLAGGVEALSPELLLGLGTGLGAGAPVPGEGACLLFLERLEDAQAAGRPIWGELAGWGGGFDAARAGKRGAKGWAAALRDALSQAGLAPGEVGGVSLRRSGLAEVDRREEAAVAEVFGGDIPAAQAVAAALGDTLGAAGAFQAAAALEILGRGTECRAVLVSGGDCHGRSAALVLRRWEHG